MERRVSVLIVEDEDVLRTLVAQFLRNEGFDVREARDGGEGVQAFTDHGPFDLMLVDIKMPVFNGVEVCRRVKLVAPDQRRSSASTRMSSRRSGSTTSSPSHTTPRRSSPTSATRSAGAPRARRRPRARPRRSSPPRGRPEGRGWLGQPPATPAARWRIASP